MATELDELKASVIMTIHRELDRIASARGWGPADPTLLPGRPMGGGYNAEPTVAFTTGYDTGTGETTMAMTWDASIWDGGDICL
jgi:hypothetical protein